MWKVENELEEDVKGSREGLEVVSIIGAYASIGEKRSVGSLESRGEEVSHAQENVEEKEA